MQLGVAGLCVPEPALQLLDDSVALLKLLQRETYGERGWVAGPAAAALSRRQERGGHGRGDG